MKMKHRYLLIGLDKRYSTEESYDLANAISEFRKVVSVGAIYDYQIKKRKKHKS